MIRPPLFARIAAGAAVYVIEETRKIPATAATLPMTAVSKVLQTGMHVQQFATSLALRGDQVFSRFTDTAEDQPAWAAFDEDAVESDTAAAIDEATEGDSPSGDNGSTSDNGSKSAGRFALYSMPPNKHELADSGSTVTVPVAARNGNHAKVDQPEIAEYLDYDSLTLVQLRARLKSLSLDELTALLDYEDRTLARAPFQTMLANRITSAKAK